MPLISVARFLGHKATKMTERYAHLGHEMRRVEEWHDEPSGTPRSRASDDSAE